MSSRIALLGQPNSGRSTVYNTLTGAHQHVGNWPGKTVERNDGYYTYDGTKYTVTDLPGSYGLTGNSDEEIITANFIKADNADLVCVLVDASQLERSMYMLAEFAALKKPAVLLLNMMDMAKLQKKQINHKLLEKRLGIPVLPFTAAEPKGYYELKKLLASELKKPHWLASVPDVVSDDAMAGFVFGVNIAFVFLEEIGFLARAAYQFDGILSKLGLQGKAICPVLMGFGCTIGGALVLSCIVYHIAVLFW